MEPRTSLEIRLATTPDEMATALRIRHRVFVEEQGVPVELEQDADDCVARHYLLWVGEEAAGTARLVLKHPGPGKIGRVAVLAEHRGEGRGERLMRHLIDAARAHGCRELVLDAQLPVLRFYERLGFTAEGDEFLDAGIRHLRMRRSFDGEL
jgi:predicted GNAT family N-acyltransferase